MTSLQIIPNWKNKSARFKGTIAAGEYVDVSIVNIGEDGDEFITDTTNLRLRVVDEFGRTLAQFPLPEEPDAASETDEGSAGEGTDDGEEGEATEGESEGWDSDTSPLHCTLNLNTVQMLRAVPPHANVPLWFVLDAYKGATDEDEGEFTLYFKDHCEVTHWPRRRGEEEPTDLGRYKDIIAEFGERLTTAEQTVTEAAQNAQNAAASAQAAEQSASAANTGAWSAASAAQTSAATAGESALEAKGYRDTAEGYKDAAADYATAAAGSKSNAAGSAEDAEAWAVGERGGTPVESGDDTYHNNAKYYAEQAEETLDGKADKSDTYTKTAVDSAIASAVSAEAATRAAADTALSTVLAGSYKGVSYDEENQTLVFTKNNNTTDTLDAKPFIKDGMVSDVYIGTGADAGYLVITFNTDATTAGKQTIKILLTDIFNPSNYYNKDAADGRFVQKVTGKGLMTDAEKQKLAGIDEGANNYVLPAATASTLGGVKQGTGCTIAPDGTLNVTGGGGGTVDDSVTRTSANPVKSSGIWSAIWGALTALPTGVASLYDWCVAQLAGKLNRTEAVDGYTKWVLTVDNLPEGYSFVGMSWAVGNGWVADVKHGGVGSGVFCGGTQESVELSLVYLGTVSTLSRTKIRPTKTSELTNDGNGTSPFALATDIPDVSGKADAADLRYRIAEAAVRKTLPTDCFPVTFSDGGGVHSSRVIVPESEASAIGDMYIKAYGSEYRLFMVTVLPHPPAPMLSALVATFNSDGTFKASDFVDLQFGGVSPVADTSPTLADIHILADRAVNRITATDETSIDIELPGPVIEPAGVRRARDFFLDVDNSMNSGDLALEFTELGVEYLFVTDADDSIGDMMTVSGYGTGQSGDGERVRLYFTECAIEGVAPRPGPIFHVARVTLSAEIDELPTTQGGN